MRQGFKFQVGFVKGDDDDLPPPARRVRPLRVFLVLVLAAIAVYMISMLHSGAPRSRWRTRRRCLRRRQALLPA